MQHLNGSGCQTQQDSPTESIRRELGCDVAYFISAATPRTSFGLGAREEAEELAPRPKEQGVGGVLARQAHRLGDVAM